MSYALPSSGAFRNAALMRLCFRTFLCLGACLSVRPSLFVISAPTQPTLTLINRLEKTLDRARFYTQIYRDDKKEREKNSPQTRSIHRKDILAFISISSFSVHRVLLTKLDIKLQQKQWRTHETKSFTFKRIWNVVPLILVFRWHSFAEQRQLFFKRPVLNYPPVA